MQLSNPALLAAISCPDGIKGMLLYLSKSCAHYLMPKVKCHLLDNSFTMYLGYVIYAVAF